MKQAIRIVLPIILIGILLTHPEAAKTGAQEGIDLCLKSVIPSLFPFIFLTSFINSQAIRLRASRSTILHKLGIPQGAESIFMMGLLGGYPVGARSIAESYGSGCLSKRAAHRMLGFCNNVGPSFIFGILVYQFSNRYTLWCIWGIQILSAILTCIILPNKDTAVAQLSAKQSKSIPQCLSDSLRAMASICGWIVLFRILCTFMYIFIPFSNSPIIGTILSGTLELTNGCLMLSGIQNEVIRFIVCNFLLCAGGLCITMQTASVVKNLGFGMYFLGKAIQCILSVVLSILTAALIF